MNSNCEMQGNVEFTVESEKCNPKFILKTHDNAGPPYYCGLYNTEKQNRKGPSAISNLMQIISYTKIYQINITLFENQLVILYWSMVQFAGIHTLLSSPSAGQACKFTTEVCGVSGIWLFVPRFCLAVPLKFSDPKSLCILKEISWHITARYGQDTFKPCFVTR